MDIELILDMAREDTIIKIAKKMLRKGLDIEVITETTDLNKAVVLNLKEELGDVSSALPDNRIL